MDGRYERFELHTEANGDTCSKSEALGADFVFLVEGGLGRFPHRDSATGEWLNTLGAERSATRAEATARQMGASAKRWHTRNRSANYDRRHGRRQNAISTRASPTRGEFATGDRADELQAEIEFNHHRQG